ncbi:DUF4936 family protein [Crenobacter caeni]|uniref:DUF4936 family protein n=1 Tax=Crenobacter caeni TaxID=2705474 RepID=A0A6B2KQJ2_9NEIS|nr:DUF4936 family protein [Crenobacter caeni]NDV12177.1 DUF4936 family protein [Crenobacter caeni]
MISELLEQDSKASLYVYYRPPVPSTALAHEVRALQAVLAKQHSVRVQLLARHDAKGETWMEVYEGLSDPRAFDAALAEALEEAKLAGRLGARHHEWFAPYPGSG